MTSQATNRINTVLVVGYVWPEPDSSAAGRHMLTLLEFFKAHHCRVVFATPSQPTDHMIELGDYGIESKAIQLNDSSFDEFVSALSPQLVLFDRFMMEEQFGWRVEKACPDALRILDTEDLQSLRGARQQALKSGTEFSLNDLKSSDLAKREIAAIYRSDLSLIISDFEHCLLTQEFKINTALLHHLPFIIDTQFESTQTPEFQQRNHFVTIGNFRHAPNWDSVLYLQEIWPMIRKVQPKAELHIYGSYPPKKATQLDNPKTGFRIKGWAEDAHKVLSQARVCLSPLRFGAGIKGKLIDSMLTGTPSVTTQIGAEGMCGELPWPGLVADSKQQIVEAAIQLYQDQQLWEAKRENIGPILNSRYQKNNLLPVLWDKLETTYNNLASHRNDNFIGSMLLHHTMKSTQFMSKWIEAKNKLKKH